MSTVAEPTGFRECRPSRRHGRGRQLGLTPRPWDDLLAFLFDGGELNDDQIARLNLVDGELAAVKFCTEEQAQQRLRPQVWRRAATAFEALNTGHVGYLHDGYPDERGT